jgi:hypothetical protein
VEDDTSTRGTANFTSMGAADISKGIFEIDVRDTILSMLWRKK